MRTISVSNTFFEQAEKSLRDGKEIRLLVQGNSMLPFIIGGQDTVTLSPFRSEDLPLGSAAFYKWNNRYMIHRLVKKDKDRYHFLGDGNIFRIETVTHKEVIGILQTIHHPDGTDTDATTLTWRRKGMWWYRIRPLRRYILFAYKRIKRIPDTAV